MAEHIIYFDLIVQFMHERMKMQFLMIKKWEKLKLEIISNTMLLISAGQWIRFRQATTKETGSVARLESYLLVEIAMTEPKGRPRTDRTTLG